MKKILYASLGCNIIALLLIAILLFGGAEEAESTKKTVLSAEQAAKAQMHVSNFIVANLLKSHLGVVESMQKVFNGLLLMIILSAGFQMVYLYYTRKSRSP